jgi:CRP/FNR family transcriptional regulator, anaerobic regulatory protein
MSSRDDINGLIMTHTNWIAHFPGLRRLEPDISGPLIETSQIVKLPAGTRIFGPGQAPSAYLLLIDGTVRVQQVSESGREIVLYRVSAGESCALTTACLMGYEDYQAEGLAETDIEAVAIPRATFDDLIARSPTFRKFVFTAFSVRITNLLRVIEDVAFARVDVRLAERLLELSGPDGHIELTHQQVAAELGTAREVVSRQLHEFQRRGWIATSRGVIDISRPEELRKLAALS